MTLAAQVSPILEFEFKTQPSFVHRNNGDGTLDSICTCCFTTVGTERCESNLETSEKQHVCDDCTVDTIRRHREELRVVQGARNRNGLNSCLADDAKTTLGKAVRI